MGEEFEDILNDEDFLETNKDVETSNNKPITDDIFNDIDSKPITTDTLTSFLEFNGITDGKLKIVNEHDSEEEVDFYALTKDEQLEILKSFTVSPTKLDENEETFLNYLKENNLNVVDFLNKYKEEIIKEVSPQNEQLYEIDNYDDQELFLLDLKSKFESLTDEELASELERELQNEPLFKKKVDTLRSEYKKLEDQYKEQKQAEFNSQKEQEYNQFIETMVDVATKTNELYDIELEDDDKNGILSFLLELDDNGASEFSKKIANPENLYKAAWFLRYGDEAIDALKKAYQEEINKLRKDSKPQVVIKKQDKPKTIFDLD